MQQECAINVSSGRALLRPEIPTIANYFGDAGYATGDGKWHLVPTFISSAGPWLSGERVVSSSILSSKLLGQRLFDDVIFTTAQKNSFRVTAPMLFC